MTISVNSKKKQVKKTFDELLSDLTGSNSEKVDALKKIDPEMGQVLAENLQGALPAISLTSHSSLTTAFINDGMPELIFAQQVIGYSSNNKNDVLIAISTSGNSRNVVNAVKAAKAIGLKTIALTGENESELSGLATICIKAPASETYKVQEYHLPIYHYICIELEKRI